MKSNQRKALTKLLSLLNAASDSNTATASSFTLQPTAANDITGQTEAMNHTLDEQLEILSKSTLNVNDFNRLLLN